MAKFVKSGEEVQLRDGRIGTAVPSRGNQVTVWLESASGGGEVKVYPKHLKVISSIYRKPIPIEDSTFTD